MATRQSFNHEMKAALLALLMCCATGHQGNGWGLGLSQLLSAAAAKEMQFLKVARALKIERFDNNNKI